MLSPFDHGDALIRHWLRVEPDNDLETWSVQLAQSQWLEERLFKALGQTIHGKKAGK